QLCRGAVPGAGRARAAHGDGGDRRGPRRADARAPRGGARVSARRATPPEPALGIIGGSGLYEMEGIEDLRWVRVRTPFGEASDQFCTGRLGARRVIFLPRHG